MNIRSLDRIRQWANLVFAVGQILVTILAFGLGTSFEQAAGSSVTDPPVVPAGYAFIVWTLIYAGSLAYAIHQFRANLADDPLLRRIGFYTALCFLATCGWLVAARTGFLWVTVFFILVMAYSLGNAFRIFWDSTQLSVTQRKLVLMPISIFAGWVTVVMFANAASVIKGHGWPHFLLDETGWSLVILAAASLVVTFALHKSHDNFFYAWTVVWAFGGIAVRSFATLNNGPVAWAAMAAAVVALANAAVTRYGRGNSNHGLLQPAHAAGR